MRLKATPRQRRPSYPSRSTNDRENISSTDIALDVNKELKNIAEYGKMLENMKKTEVKNHEAPEIFGDFRPMQQSSGKYCAEVHSMHDVNGNIQETFEAVNLSTKNNSGKKCNLKNEIASRSSAADDKINDDKFAGSLLYQIMTDPKFVENIKNTKQVVKLTCKFCKNEFNNYDELQDHLESTLNKFNQITCCACGKTFGQKRYLRYHQRYHVVNDKFTCEICTKKYSRMDNLTRHRAYHTNPDKYQCKICNKTFSRRDLMTKHSKSHNEKKFHCVICKATFPNFAEMEAHKLALHTIININLGN